MGNLGMKEKPTDSSGMDTWELFHENETSRSLSLSLFLFSINIVELRWNLRLKIKTLKINTLSTIKN